jgi:predicted metalloprotease with PDZ domain
VEVILSDGWKGTSADLKLLKQVRNLQWLRAINVPLQGADVSMISELSQLMQLDLYGTGVSSADTEKLATALPNATVDRRNGALLGVKGLPNMPNCIINDVPPGTAAEAAGIRAGDEIVSFNGQPVHNFEEFTALVADKKGGEQVKVELRREEQLLAKDVTLGRWTADAASTGQFQPRAFIRPALPAVPAAPNR